MNVVLKGVLCFWVKDSCSECLNVMLEPVQLNAGTGMLERNMRNKNLKQVLMKGLLSRFAKDLS